MKILAIGNSFSQDELRFLHGIAKSAGREVMTANLYIGGCSLETHIKNIRENASLYEYQLNGWFTGEYISIDDALKREDWDIVFTHQASAFAGVERTYYPYLTLLLEKIKQIRPKAEIWLDETWAYEYSSTHEGFSIYKKDSRFMHARVKEICEKVAKDNSLPLICSGDAVNAVKSLKEFDSEHGGQSLYRDGFHMHLIYGRYLLGCLLYETLVKGNVLDAPFIAYDKEAEPADIKLLELIKYTVHGFMLNKKNI